MTEDEMVAWHHQLDGHEFEQALGVGDGQGSMACCSPWGCKELDMTDMSIPNSLVISSPHSSPMATISSLVELIFIIIILIIAFINSFIYASLCSAGEESEPG